MIPWVNKIRVLVRLAVAGESPVEGHFWLQQQAERHAGAETLLDRLNEAKRVLPFQRASDGVTVLVSREQVVWVAPGPEVDPALVQPATYLATRTERVHLRLLDGGTLDGTLVIEMPTEFNRASDFLNGEDDFFPLVTEDGPRLVRKSCVLDVELREAGARAA